jgi:hypothetical protein
MTDDLRSERIRALGDAARELEKLEGHPGWEALKSEFGRMESSYSQSLARKLVSGGISAKPVDQREIDYQRGFFAAVRAILRAPDNAKAALEKALEREDTRE